MNLKELFLHAIQVSHYGNLQYTSTGGFLVRGLAQFIALGVAGTM